MSPASESHRALSYTGIFSLCLHNDRCDDGNELLSLLEERIEAGSRQEFRLCHQLQPV